MVFFDSLDEKEVTEGLKYFASYWEYYCYTIQNPDVYTTVMTPHYLVKEIMSEIKTNSDKNTENYSFFLNKSEFYLSKKLLFPEEIFSLWIILHEKLKQSEKDLAIILHLCELLSEKFNSKEYQSYIFTQIKEQILNPNFKLDLLENLTEIFIFEFIFNNFSLKYLEKLPRKLFSTYYIEELDGRKYFSTNYPLKTHNTFENYEDYIKAASREMDNLTFQIRFERFIELLQSAQDYYFFIFYVEGICFDNQLNFEDVSFYNPKKISMLKDEFDPEKDIFDGANYEVGMNVIAKVKCFDIDFGKELAIKKIEQICDVIKLFDNSKIRYFLNTTYYKVLDSNKSMTMGTLGFGKEYISKYDIKINNDSIPDINDFVKMLYENTDVSDSDKEILIDTLHYYRKAADSSRPEDKLLNYWIALEKIFLSYNFSNKKSKFEKINILVSSFLIERFIFQRGWRIYNHIDRLLKTKTSHNGYFVSEINIPVELQLEANIGEHLQFPVTIQLSKFINKIPELTNVIDNQFFIEELNKTYNFYNNHEQAKTEIEKNVKDIRNELLLIYRQRNQIVHNATYDETMIEFNISQIKSITTIVLYDLFNALKVKKSLEKAILDIYIQSEQDLFLAKNDHNYLFMKRL